MSVKKYFLDGSAITSLKIFYDELEKTLPLPGYFGRNLDALADVLTTDLSGPCEIIWENSNASKQAMKGDFRRIRTVLVNVARERRDIRVIFN